MSNSKSSPVSLGEEMISAEPHSWANKFHHLELYIRSRVVLRKHHVEEEEGCVRRCVYTARREGQQRGQEALAASEVY